MPDEYICQWCKEYDDCIERKRVEAMDDVVVDCEGFEEVDYP